MNVPSIRMKVAHGNYDVFSLNPQTGEKTTANAAVICFNRKTESGDVLDACELNI